MTTPDTPTTEDSNATGSGWRRASLKGLGRLASLDRSFLSIPQTIGEKLDWIEARGRPDYLDVAIHEEVLPDGRTLLVYPPPSGYRPEIQQVYRDALEQADPPGRIKILRSYASNFPNLAFDPDAWLWPLWQEWRARYSRSDRQLLAALARGIQAKGSGWMSESRSRVWTLAQARRHLARLRGSPRLRLLYRCYCEGRRSPDEEVQQRTQEKRYLGHLIRSIERRTAYRTSADELARKKLSGVLLVAVSKAFRVRESDLH